MLRFTLLAATVAALAVVGCGGGGHASSGSTPSPSPSRAEEPATASPAGAAALPLIPLPARAVATCQRAQAHARFTVLCPARLPRGVRSITPGVAPAPLVAHGGSEVLDFGYSGVAGPEGSVPVRLNAPARFLHFVVGRAFLGIPPGARPARLGGRQGLLAKATPNGAFGSAPYFDNHVRFLWREHGTRYVATLHTFGEQATERLLDRLLRELRPARSLHADVPRADATAAIPIRPSAIAPTSTTVWLSTEQATFGEPGVLRIDPRTMAVHGDRGPAQIDTKVAAGPAGIWTVTTPIVNHGHALSRLQLRHLDPVNGETLTRTQLGQAQGSALAVAGDSVWVSANRFRGDAFKATATATVWRIDPRNGGITARTRIPAGAGALLVADGAVWATGAGTPVVTRLDARTGAVTGTVRVGPRPFALASADGAIWVTDTQDATVRRIDPHTLRVTATIHVGTAPHGIAADSRGLWVAVLGDSAVARIDPVQGRIAQRVHTGGDPVAIAADGHYVWVALNSDHALLRLTP